jgi:hypothetical protein
MIGSANCPNAEWYVIEFLISFRIGCDFPLVRAGLIGTQRCYAMDFGHLTWWHLDSDRLNQDC